jgi:D-lyxose ketol-isomerase
MKRSEINALMRDTLRFLADHHFNLPPFAYWSPEVWQSKGRKVVEIIQNQMGWDITDFGSGDFHHTGAILFTLRNGRLEDVPRGGKSYAEKILVADEGQAVPMHFHYKKTEDIINRAGGILVVEVYNATPKNQLATTPVKITLDGVTRTVIAGSKIELQAGESATLYPRMYHKLWGKQGAGKVLVGEVSSVNDDRVDNYFLEKVTRFDAIEEDLPPLHLLYADYPKYVKDLKSIG